VLGGFNPAGHLPCYIVRIEGKHRQSWIMRIDVDEDERKYTVHMVGEDDVPWEDWAGSRVGKRPLIDGDKPETFAFKRMVARCRRPYPRMPR
jgi:hypothetical protein